MSKHSEWQKKREAAENLDNSEFNSSSFVFMRVILYANLILCLLIFIDLFLPNIFVDAEVFFVHDDSFLATSLDDSFGSSYSFEKSKEIIIEKNDIVKIGYSPIFKHQKEYIHLHESVSIGQYFIPIITIILNLFSFLFLLKNPGDHREIINNKDLGIGDLTYSHNTLSKYLLFVFFFPFILALNYWYKLILLLFN